MSGSVDFDIRKVTETATPVLDEMGFELVDIECLSQYGRWVLMIYADKEGGITLDECARVSREVGNLLDVKDIIPNEYVLEVSSPGLNRPLKKEKDFERAIGKNVKIKMLAPINGRRRFTGDLKKVVQGTVYLEIDNDLFALSWKDIEKANLVYDF
ncbi:MAG: ribosome maturation factor RimP [Deltaproteobacteria bacterium]|nr:ribosome maturation factor RimP [Deltaproteobacteria bacterium]